MTTTDPLIVSRFDVGMEPAPEEEQVFIVGAVAEDGRPVALFLDPEARAKVGRWLLPHLADEVEQLRARVTGVAALDDDRLVLIRKRRTHCEATRFETEDERPLHVWGPSQYPGQEMCQRCTTQRAWAEEPDTDEGILLAELDRLRARVAELEAETYVARRLVARAVTGLMPHGSLPRVGPPRRAAFVVRRRSTGCGPAWPNWSCSPRQATT
ncbi:hypothetical protein ACF06X_33550 [Streptomyces sp. NPDC015346]|uniref:hypothetical protein n=1 Tax=Streptomyces sp. NPDC015346 TaxID=3364954 RepID=UPI0036F8BFC0